MNNADGSGTCDRCGAYLPNTGVAYCAPISILKSDLDILQAHLCNATCVTEVLVPALTRVQNLEVYRG